ncbi:MAG TPA: urease accessory protein UreD [Kofleriaceae bacterium]|nr:urease accessory protein UreD [Kofleriaceae bacterium]
MSIAAGEGAARVARVAGRSAITRCQARAPLVLLSPRGHGDAAWIVAGTLGGGLVDGDRVELALAIEDGATCVLATQASTKIYKGASSQRLDARVGAGALLACVPDPVVGFADARYRQDATIALDPDASLVWLDGATCGRRAHGERWDFASYAARVAIDVGGAPRVRDGVVLDEAHGSIAARLGRFDAIATIAAIGPRAAPVAEALVAGASAIARDADVLIAPSPIEGGAIARVTAVSVEALTRAVRALLAPLAAILGDDPFRGR